MYLQCISSVSCVCPARLGRSVQDTSIVMYPACILKDTRILSVFAPYELIRDVGPALQQLRVREPSLESIAVPPAEGQSVLPCEGNPCGLVCQACKAFKQVGICSHVLTINHILTRFNVRFQLKSVQTNALKKKAGLMGNKRKAPLPALQREPQVAPDSSDEEAERLQLLGQQGK